MYSPFFLLGGDFKTLKKSPPGWFLNTNKQLMSTIPCSNFKIFLSFKLKAYVFYIISVHFPNQSHLQAESRRGSFLLTHKRGECWDLGIHGEETLSIRSWPNTSIFLQLCPRCHIAFPTTVWELLCWGWGHLIGITGGAGNGQQGQTWGTEQQWKGPALDPLAAAGRVLPAVLGQGMGRAEKQYAAKDCYKHPHCYPTWARQRVT